MSGECTKCGHHTLDCICEEQEWMNASLGKHKKETLMDAHAKTVDKEEELEPDFTWKIYKTHLNEDIIHFEGCISINRFMSILTLLKDEAYTDIFCKFPIDITGDY